MASVTINLSAGDLAEETITADMLGANYVHDYERIGDLPWERYDELIEQIGATTLRFPGGNAAETTFNYLDPNSSTDLMGRAAMGMADFIAYAGTQAIDPTIILPNMPFLPNASHALLYWDDAKGDWAIDPAAEAAARAVIDTIIIEAVLAAQAAGVELAAVEIGNEYPGVKWTTDSGSQAHMNATQYGLLADKMAQWAQETLEAYGSGGTEVLVQVWGDFNHEGISLADIEAANEKVLEQFTQAGLDAIDGTVNHIYFRDGKTSASGEDTHSYATLDDRIADMASFSDIWVQATGRDLSLHVTEWNVQKRSIDEPSAAYWNANDNWVVSDAWEESAHFGMKQLAPMLEMIAAFNMNGVDAAQVWSIMYNAAALGMQNDGGTLTPAGELFALMQDVLPGTSYMEVDAESDLTDVHVFRDTDQTHVFVSLLSTQAHEVTLDLTGLSPGHDTVTVTYLRADESSADGSFRADGNTYIVGDQIWLEADIAAELEVSTQTLDGDSITLSLGAYEVALITFDNAEWTTITGSDATEKLQGTEGDDRIVGLAGEDYIRGEDGKDILEGGAGDDAIYGGTGADSIDGGDGADWLIGGSGRSRDTIHGGAGDDIAYGGDGGDEIWGGMGDDQLHGEGHNDKLVGQWGHDTLFGGDGDDLLLGGGMRDTLDGGDGDDVLRGHSGIDVLTGGAGADTFVYRMDLNTGIDQITDWEDGIDRIEMRGSNGAGFDDLEIVQKREHTDVIWETSMVRLLNTDASTLDADDFIFL